MKVLLTVFSPPTGSYGSLTRVMALAKGFLARGHSVSFCASGQIAALLETKQFKVHLMPEPTMLGLAKPISNIIQNRSQHVQIPVKEGKAIGSVWFVYFMTGLLHPKFLKKLVQAQIIIIQNEKPDIIVTEMDLGAYLAACITKTPLVTTFAMIALAGRHTFFWYKAQRVIQTVLKEYGCAHATEPEKMLMNQLVLKVIPSIPELDGTDPDQENICYAGNLLEPLKDEQNDFPIDQNKRYVFVYLGTGSISLQKAEAVLPDVFKADPNVVCYVAAQSISSGYKIGNVNFLPYVPAEKLIPYCDLVICHGGLNTITQSIGYGVPLLMFPGPIFERRYNAEMVAKNAAGAMGELSNFSVHWIRKHYENRNAFDEGVKFLQQKFSQYQGVAGVLKEIEKWLGSTDL
jgi:UDP:flavonoid glycosyltransferase YjiC (YdhE family)